MKTTKRTALFLSTLAVLSMVESVSAYYDPGVQRWINRDPIEESGGINLFQFCKNNTLAYIDSFGLLGKGRPPGWKPPPVIHSPRGQDVFGSCRSKPPCLGHNNLPGGIWDGEGGQFNYAGLDEGETRPYPGGRPDLHFLPLSEADKDARAAIEAPCDRRAFEKAMHEGQDHFSHRVPRPDLRHPILPFIQGYPGCEWNPGNFEFGHWLWLDAPDKNMDAWNDAKKWTADWLKEWNKRCATSN